MIHEVDEALRALLAGSGLQESGVELVFDAPTKDWAARRNAPTVSVFLYDIREDPARRESGTAPEYDEHGVCVGRRTPPRWFALTYLVTAWTSRPQDEHRLLSQVLTCLAGTEVLPAELCTGSLAALGLAVGIETAGGGGQGPSAAEVWSALGGELKASVDVRVSAPLAGDRTRTGPPVTEGLVLRSAQQSEGRPAGTGRRLRYEDRADPGPDGFAGPGERRVPARRRRRGHPR